MDLKLSLQFETESFHKDIKSHDDILALTHSGCWHNSSTFLQRVPQELGLRLRSNTITMGSSQPKSLHFQKTQITMKCYRSIQTLSTRWVIKMQFSVIKHQQVLPTFCSLQMPLSIFVPPQSQPREIKFCLIILHQPDAGWDAPLWRPMFSMWRNWRFSKTQKDSFLLVVHTSRVRQSCWHLFNLLCLPTQLACPHIT